MFFKQHSIKKFWNWFLSVSDDLGKDLTNELILEKINRKVSKLGNFAWEVGAGVKKPYAFVISPGGDKRLLLKTKEVIEQSPNIPKWEFHASKPPKEWKLIFNIKEKKNREIEINAQNWKYVLFQFPEGDFDIIIEAPRLTGLKKDSQLLAAEIVLDGILGEEKRMVYIGNIEIIEKFEQSEVNDSSKITVLNNHLSSLIK